MHWCMAGLAASARAGIDDMMMIASAPFRLMAALAIVSAPPVAAERPARYSEEAILNGTTVAIASQQLCGFRVDEPAIRALLAAKLPDLTPELIALQLRGYARILPTLGPEQRQRHCTEIRQLAAAAGWLR